MALLFPARRCMPAAGKRQVSSLQGLRELTGRACKACSVFGTHLHSSPGCRCLWWRHPLLLLLCHCWRNCQILQHPLLHLQAPPQRRPALC